MYSESTHEVWRLLIGWPVLSWIFPNKFPLASAALITCNALEFYDIISSPPNLLQLWISNEISWKSHLNKFISKVHSSCFPTDTSGRVLIDIHFLGNLHVLRPSSHRRLTLCCPKIFKKRENNQVITHTHLVFSERKTPLSITLNWFWNNHSQTQYLSFPWKMFQLSSP